MKKHVKKRFRIDEITLVLIVVFILLIFSAYNKSNEKMEAEKIADIILDEHDISFANNGIVDESKLREIKSMSYTDFKKYLNAENDFCIYIEDGHGNIVLAKGSSKLNGNGVYCRE